MRKNDDILKDLEDYLSDTEKSVKYNKLSKRLRVLINYYKGVSNKDNAEEHKVSIRTISRWVNRYDIGGRYEIINYDYSGRMPKMDEKQKEKIEKALKRNPLKLGLGYSIWNGSLLKRYINGKLGIEVSKIYCDKLLSDSDTLYKVNNYDAEKNKRLTKITNDLINEYENNEYYSVWHFDTYYLGRRILKNLRKSEEIDKSEVIYHRGKRVLKNLFKKSEEIEKVKKIDKSEEVKKIKEIEIMLRGNDIHTYSKYILYGFYNVKELFEYDIKNHINKEIFIDTINEFVDDKKQNLKEDIKLIIVLKSNNIFKSLIEENTYYKNGVEVIFLPKKFLCADRINLVWDEIERNNFTIKGKSENEISDEFESLIK
ncbi:helix-turn-helix domain-containing protein [Clostridium sp.]|uniref:helix-turn-helix domain-containing protein n=1 Tax=Clostridium sp. TaxID=1506 RepID=UPI001A60EAB1|nr:helix-turn-helix domain-containing protein [Clostridium sp.]MBK5241688.1 helix-turn-helix domain-containing protein [Clostridium sp.]